MPLIDPELPVIGQPNTTEDPKIRAALAAILGLINGGLDEENVPGLGEGGGGGAGTVPTGGIIMWSEPAAPAGFLFAAGGSVAVATYPELHAVIGYRFGGAGANFNLPNFQDRFPIGAWTSIPAGATGGENEHTLTTSEMPSHFHAAGRYGTGAAGAPAGFTFETTTGGAVDHSITTDSAGGGAPHNNMPKYLGISFVIKT